MTIDPDELLLAYRLGIFPMAEARNSRQTLWVRPQERAVIPLDGFHVPHRLARTVRNDRFEIRIDTAFGEVIQACAAAGSGRPQTWINDDIIDVFEKLRSRNLAHSVEAYADGGLAGGLYGLALGGVFFGESMYSRTRDASKVALVHLAARLKAGGFALLDAQFPNEHLTQFGAVVVGRARFEKMLSKALKLEADFQVLDHGSGSAIGSAAGGSDGTRASLGAAARPRTTGAGALVLQLITHTS
ncbi:MAG: leucyl/phenylalanyl-tRNA--protein transferase [Alphaproteobacteria bacterium]